MGRPVILCVDDEPGILHSLERCLAFEHYDVLTAASGMEGLKALETCGGRVDLIIVDHRMPQMMGDEFLHCVKQRYGRIQAIMISGYLDISSMSRVLNDGEIFRIIEKPWDNRELLDAIRMALPSPASGAR